MIYGILNLFICYLIGSIPFAFIIVYVFKKCDIRTLGSGNCGATNVTRNFGKKFGITVFLLDFFKGFIGAYLSGYLLTDFYFSIPNSYLFYYLSIVFIVVGHMFPVFLKFRGGKGAASGIGIVFCMSPVTGIIVMSFWVVTFFFFKIVSLSTVLCCVILPFSVHYTSDFPYITNFFIIASILVILKHRENIKRLLRGEESSFRKKESKT